MDPRKVGQTWYSAYWNMSYTVLARDDSQGLPWFTVQWADGEITNHNTAVGADTLISEA